jgi:hypothetical protein
MTVYDAQGAELDDRCSDRVVTPQQRCARHENFSVHGEAIHERFDVAAVRGNRVDRLQPPTLEFDEHPVLSSHSKSPVGYSRSFTGKLTTSEAKMSFDILMQRDDRWRFQMVRIS